MAPESRAAQAPRPHALALPWGRAGGARRALWLGAGLICLLHLAGIALWIGLVATPERGPPDLQVYLEAGAAVRARAPLYWLGPWPSEMAYYYSPPFALLYAWLGQLPFRALALASLALQAACYLGAWLVWRRALLGLGLRELAAGMIAWLPLGLVYSQWYAHLAFLNVTGALNLLAALLALAIVRGSAAGAVAAALPILLLKPHWLFPLIMLVAARRWGLLARTLGGLLGAYLLVCAGYVAAVGPEYGLATLRDYAAFLAGVDRNFPWDGPGPVFTRLNHAPKQILLLYGLGAAAPVVLPLITLGLLGLLGGAVALIWRRPGLPERDPAALVLLAWLGYLVAAGMIGQLWGLDAGAFCFAFVWAAAGQRTRVAMLPFLGYACWELWSLAALAAGAEPMWLQRHVPITFLAYALLTAATATTLYRRLLRQ